MKKYLAATTSLAVLLSTTFEFVRSGEKEAPIRVGVIDTLLKSKNADQTLARMKPFAELIQERTGMKGEFSVVKGAGVLGEELNSGKVGLAVVHGIEYGWLRENCPDCRPLLLAVNETAKLQAFVLVSQKSSLTRISDFEGKLLALPSRPLHHTQLFLERLAGKPIDEFFRVKPVKNNNAAIEDVLKGKADLTVVGNVSLDAYRSFKPARFRRIKILHESPTFPAAVVVYKPDSKRVDTLEKFRKNLLKANQTTEGRQTLTLWRLTGFEPVPEDYDNVVSEIVKRFPTPDKIGPTMD